MQPCARAFIPTVDEGVTMTRNATIVEAGILRAQPCPSRRGRGISGKRFTQAACGLPRYHSAPVLGAKGVSRPAASGRRAVSGESCAGGRGSPGRRRRPADSK